MGKRLLKKGKIKFSSGEKRATISLATFEQNFSYCILGDDGIVRGWDKYINRHASKFVQVCQHASISNCPVHYKIVGNDEYVFTTVGHVPVTYNGKIPEKPILCYPLSDRCGFELYKIDTDESVILLKCKETKFTKTELKDFADLHNAELCRFTKELTNEK
jgi:hypothetical protein